MIIHAKFLGVKFLSQKISCVSPAGVKFSFLQSDESLFNNEKSPRKSQTSAKSEEKKPLLPNWLNFHLSWSEILFQKI